MDTLLYRVARRFFPRITELTARERTAVTGDIFGTFYTTPFAVWGLLWLLAITDLTLFYRESLFLLVIFALLFLFERLGFFLFVEVTPGTYVDWAWTLSSVVTWSAALIFGPTTLWLTVVWRIISFAQRWRKAHRPDWRWNVVRNYAIDMMMIVFSRLVALNLYQQWGGQFPLPGLTVQSALPALAALLVWVVLYAVVWAPLIGYYSRAEEMSWTSNITETFIRFMGITMGWRFFVDPFAILAAALYAQNGLVGYAFFIWCLVLACFLARQLSQAMETSNLRSRELEKLEQLGRALLAAVPDISQLPQLLQTHLTNMFPYNHFEICFFPELVMLHTPDDWPPVSKPVWDWAQTLHSTHSFLPNARTPWGEVLADKSILLAPIMDLESHSAIGAIYLARYRNRSPITTLIPAVQTLAAQISSALHTAVVYQKTVDYAKMEQELMVAGKIQTSFLPKTLPHLPGWQLSARLQPARETSGDFYDVIPLPNGLLGLLVADVADKGMGAALYMALSRTLIRTYAVQYDMQPEVVLQAANTRILADTQADLFVTVFYGILDPFTGVLTYCNAGHNPPYVLHSSAADCVTALPKTGMPLGIFEDTTWQQRSFTLTSGDLLLLYTDGVTDAENLRGEFFGVPRLLQTVTAHLGQPARVIQAGILATLATFTEGAPRFDDVTLMLLIRGLTTELDIHRPSQPHCVSTAQETTHARLSN